MGVRSTNIVLLLHCTITMVWLRSVLASLTLMVLVVLVVLVVQMVRMVLMVLLILVVLIVRMVLAGPKEPDD